MQFNHLKKDKQRLRTQLKLARSNIAESNRKAFSAAICETCLSQEAIRSASTIFVYISYASEVRTHELIDALLNAGKTLTVPKILSQQQMIAVPFHSWDDLKPAELGILAPESDIPLNADHDVCITPGLGFTESGNRIGFGAGYYDHWFAENQVKHKIALAFEQQIVQAIPTDQYDQKVDQIITERRVI